ncbi:MAG: DUF2851 family protein [Paludibacteraceae bacterium]|nr:DUF2851 family protein [Paludibacteraceae bacterium]
MNESFISYIWFNRLYFPTQQTLLGEIVEVVSPGIPNLNSGPDAFNAKLRIDGRLWAGNVEFHVRASDWHRHHHDSDPAYQNIILHVVLEADEQLFSDADTPIPTIVLNYPSFIRSNYDNLLTTPFGCCSRLAEISDINVTSWLEHLLVERLELRADNIDYILNATVNDWDEALYVLYARSLGSSVNSDAMQQLALSTPLRFLRHYTDRPDNLRAMLLGQAGLICRLPDTFDHQLLEREYAFLRNKYSLTAPDAEFKFCRMRPAAFPTARIVALADSVPDLPSVPDLIDNLDHLSSYTPLSLINCFLPLLFHYATIHNLPAVQDRIIDLFHTLPAERNHITRHFSKYGIKASSAAESQALIHLHKTRCLSHDCLRCRFAHLLLSKDQSPR